MSRSGVLITAFGGPDSIDACGPFMCNLMGKEPSPELVERVERRYLTIGGESPLTAIAEDIAKALRGVLGGDVPVEVGMRYWHPYIPDAMNRLVEQGAERIVTVSLSPYESKVATGAYREAVEQAAAALGGIEVVEAPHLGGHPVFRSLLASGCREALSELSGFGSRSPIVLFTAHSLPLSDLEADDPYVSGLEQTASNVAQMAGLGPAERTELGGIPVLGSSAPGSMPWAFGYQSKGNRPGEWLGPMVEDLLVAAIAGDHDGVAVCPIGFLTDHLETKYDLDVEVADAALSAGIEFARADVPNDSAEMIKAFEDAVRPLL